MNEPISWKRFQQDLCRVPGLGLSLDISRMGFEESFLEKMADPMQKAFTAMDELERGAIANPDEDRMVGHYWLRAAELSPTPAIAAEIRSTIAEIKKFALGVHSGSILTPGGMKFKHVISIGIGGSALGPMFVADALGNPGSDKCAIDFIDNTDPNGIARILAKTGEKLKETLCIVTSKSGSTPEPRNGMLLVDEEFRKVGLNFAKQSVAVTMPGSQLDQTAVKDGWLARFPMFDWIGGRTSVLSAVGLLPAALQGLDIDALLEGAAACDVATRVHNVRKNPAALMALTWFHATGGKGQKDMVVLPYKDRLLLFSRYLQQLVMESLGKRLNLKGEVVHQGIAVYGNKGSTDQHAYVQQLRDGVNNFFITFIRVLESGGSDLNVDPGATAGDYLHGFLLGTRTALFESDRASMTITIPRVEARTVGALIALFERAVGYYGTLVGVNAYNQPGVEAGKKAAATVLALQAKIIAALTATPQTAEQVAASAGVTDVEAVYLLLEHLAANGRAKLGGSETLDKMTFSKT